MMVMEIASGTGMEVVVTETAMAAGVIGTGEIGIAGIEIATVIAIATGCTGMLPCAVLRCV